MRDGEVVAIGSNRTNEERNVRRRGATPICSTCISDQTSSTPCSDLAVSKSLRSGPAGCSGDCRGPGTQSWMPLTACWPTRLSAAVLRPSASELSPLPWIALGGPGQSLPPNAPTHPLSEPCWAGVLSLPYFDILGVGPHTPAYLHTAVDFGWRAALRLVMFIYRAETSFLRDR